MIHSRSLRFPDDDVLLSRAMHVRWFEKLILDKKIHFCRFDRFNDQSEFAVDRNAMLPYLKYGGRAFAEKFSAENLRGRRISYDDWMHQKLDIIFAQLRSMRQRMFASCWTVAPELVERFWIDKEPGIAIRVRFDALKKALPGAKGVFGSLMSYDPIPADKPGAQLFEYMTDCIFTKIDFYKYEQEYRFVYIDGPGFSYDMPFDDGGCPKISENDECPRKKTVVEFPFDLGIIEELVLYGSPYHNDISREKIKEAGLTCRVTEAPWTRFFGTPFSVQIK